MAMTTAIIGGAPRSGTTSLFRYLAAHPEVVASRVKETNFFLTEPNDSDPSAVLSRYAKLFQTAEHASVRLEASPAYFREATAVAPRIRQVLPEARLIFVLRDPVSRLYTFFRAQKERAAAHVHENVRFDDYVDIICNGGDWRRIGPDEHWSRFVAGGAAVGRYADTLDTFLAEFDAEQMRVLFLDHLHRDPRPVTRDCCTFLNIHPAAFDDYRFTVENQSVAVRNLRFYRLALGINRRFERLLSDAPAIRRGLRGLHAMLNHSPQPADGMSPEARQALAAYYAPANAALRNRLQDRFAITAFPAWLDAPDQIAATEPAQPERQVAL